MTRKTLLQLVTAFETACNSHTMIHTFLYGTEDIVNKDIENKSYLIRLAPEAVSYSGNVSTFSLIIEVWGEVMQDDSDRLVIESEGESIVNDIIISVFRGLIAEGGWEISVDTNGQIDDTITATSVVHEKEARLTGWSVSIDIKGFNDLNQCINPIPET
jgi:hypothetical protein